MTATAGKTLLDSMLRSQARAPCARRISSTSSSSSSSSSSRRSSSSPTVQTSRSRPAIAHGQRPPCPLASSARPVASSSRPSILASSSARRAYATASSSSPVSATRAQSSGVRVGTLFLALSILGIGATSIGLYDYFTSLQTWPKELRTELRAALRSKSRQDYVHAHKNFRKAWEKALSPEFADQLGLLKITGIGIAWAEMLEEAARRADEGSITNARTEAYEVLAETFNWAREKLNADTNGVATPQQRLRGVAIAVKLADTAEGQRELDSQTEEQLTWAVEEVLRVTQAGAVKPEKSSVDSGVLVGELELPSWVTKSDIGATLESLGNLYARKGNVEYAMPLYLQSISLLLPPAQAKKPEPSVGDKCHAATIMNNLSSLIASAPTAPSTNIPQGTQAFAWASKASQIAKAAIASASELDTEVNTCKPVLTVALYNLGMLRLMEGDKQGAKGFLDEAKAKAKEWGLKDAEFRAAEVIKSL